MCPVLYIVCICFLKYICTLQYASLIFFFFLNSKVGEKSKNDNHILNMFAFLYLIFKMGNSLKLKTVNRQRNRENVCKQTNDFALSFTTKDDLQISATSSLQTALVPLLRFPPLTTLSLPAIHITILRQPLHFDWKLHFFRAFFFSFRERPCFKSNFYFGECCLPTEKRNSVCENTQNRYWNLVLHVNLLIYL